MNHQIQTKLHNSVLEYTQEGQRIKGNQCDKFDESIMSSDIA